MSNPYEDIDFAGLAGVEEYPEMVPGRVLHIDADFLAYQCSYEKKDDPKTLEDMYHNVHVIVEHMQLKAAAETFVLHLTPSSSDKGGRYDQAIQKRYQANRDGKEKPRYLHLIRQYMHEHMEGVMHEHCEADDGMAMAQYDAIRAGQGDLSVIASMDKDLSMVPGWHFEWDREVLTWAEEFGTIWLTEKGKLKGWGQKFFWAQMLMGDTADNIQGLPIVAAKYLNVFDKTAAIEKAQAALDDVDATEAQRTKAQKTLDARKPKKCGPAMAFKLLEDCTDNWSAFKRVANLYRAAETHQDFVHWDTGGVVPADRVFISEGHLLWMRRSHAVNDFNKWIKELHIANAV